VAKSLSRVVPDSHRRMIYEFAMHRWPGTESNRRRQPFQGCALPTHEARSRAISCGCSRATRASQPPNFGSRTQRSISHSIPITLSRGFLKDSFDCHSAQPVLSTLITQRSVVQTRRPAARQLLFFNSCSYCCAGVACFAGLLRDLQSQVVDLLCSDCHQKDSGSAYRGSSPCLPAKFYYPFKCN
jgi:hypothetical protein